MKLITKELEKKIPGLYETENVAIEEKELVAKFFAPWNQWTWYAVEYDAEKGLCFGYVSHYFNEGLEDEWGYFNINELKEIKGPWGLGIERDLYFTTTKFAEL